MKVCVQGLWHLGSVTAACLASVGHQVIGLDSENDVVQRMMMGKGPVSEPGLDELLKAGFDSGQLRFTSQAKEAVKEIKVLWVTLDTLVGEDDLADTEYVLQQVKSTLPLVPEGTTILISSQLPVGSVAELESFAIQYCNRTDLNFACSPENLRLGKALDVFLNPDRIVAGVRNEVTRSVLSELLSPVTDRIEWMSVESAEMTKHAINSFLATSVTFANEIAAICERVGADAKEVERGLKSESRIGPKAYLSPGAAFAGGTLARDVQFLHQQAVEKNFKTPLLSSIRISNDEHRKWVHRQLQKKFPNLAGATIAIWGLTYKPGTSTLRRSLAVELCYWLLEKGVRLSVHDPAAEDLPVDWSGLVTRKNTPLEALNQAEALVVATEWSEYKSIEPKDMTGLGTRLLLVDANRFLQHLKDAEGIEYVAVGIPQKDVQG